MGSRVVLAFALCFAFAGSAHASQVRLFHDSFSSAYRTPFGAVPTGSKVTLRLRVVGRPVTSVAAHVGKRFVKMRRRGEIWSATAAMPSTPGVVPYTFRVRRKATTFWYGDNGDADTLRGGTGMSTSVETFPYTITVYARGFAPPAWEQGAVVYSIFPDRFRNADPSNDYCRAGSTSGCPEFYGDQHVIVHPTWNEAVVSPPSDVDFFGGDLHGVEQKLGYVKSLGVDAIMLNPIFKARSNHRYDTDDYSEVDPALGGNDAWRSLRDAANAKGIRLILDGVFNRVSSDSLYVDRYHRYPTDGACESASSTYRSWFQSPCDTLPVFDRANADVIAFLHSVAKAWLLGGGSGWRLDAAQEIDHPWWRAFRSDVKAFDADAALIGDADATEFLLGNEMDGVMNDRFREDALAFAGGSMSPAELGHALNAMREEYPVQALNASFSLIDSHDTPRALASLSRPGLMLAAALQYTAIGAPMTLYGDEVGIAATSRAPYPWSDASGDINTYGPPDLGLLDYYTKLGRARADLPALRATGFTSLLATSDVLAFLRSGNAAKPVVVVLNRGSSTENTVVPLKRAYSDGTTLRDALSGATFTVSGGSVRVSLGARGALILVGA